MNDRNLLARALWIEGPGSCAVREETLNPPVRDEVVVKTLFSGISRGTERVIFSGSVPESERASMRAPFQEGDLPGPLKYGYCNVGRVEAGERSLVGQTVFCLFPHQSRYVVPRQALVPVPPGVPPERALLTANMETAVNAVWDSGMSVGMRVVVVGAGAVGLLVAHLAALTPGVEVAIIEKNRNRWPTCQALGLTCVERPEFTPDIVFEASASADGLQQALNIAGMETRIVELSWFGDKDLTINLGGAFHSKRLSIIASQVGQIAPRQRARWTHRQRLRLAISLLADPRLDTLISATTSFATLAKDYERILLHSPDTLCHAVDYRSEA
ncbi:MAG: dehydrogenase [Pseudomonadota bacterium]